MALVEGRKAILLSMYEVILSILEDLFRTHYTKDELGAAAANVVNRITHRKENRPDLRNLNNSLGKELKDLTSRQMIKEAASLVLIFDSFIGDFTSQDVDINRLEEAEILGGRITKKIISKLDPRYAKPEEIYTSAISMAGNLSSIADN